MTFPKDGSANSRETVESFVEALGCGDDDAALGFVSADVHFVPPVTEVTSSVGDFSGRDGFHVWWGREICCRFRLRLLAIRQLDPDRVFVELGVSSYLYPKHSVGDPMAWICTVERDRIQGIEIFQDAKRALVLSTAFRIQFSAAGDLSRTDR